MLIAKLNLTNVYEKFTEAERCNRADSEGNKQPRHQERFLKFVTADCGLTYSEDYSV